MTRAAITAVGAALIVVSACGTETSHSDARPGAQTVVLRDSGPSTTPGRSAIRSAHSYFHTAGPFTTGLNWTITWSASGQFAIIVGYLVVGQPRQGGPGSGRVIMRGAGRHSLAILSERAYSVTVRSAR